MTQVNILFSARDDLFQAYKSLVESGLKANGIAGSVRKNHEPETVDYIIYAPSSPLQDFSPFTKCKAVLGIWAGLELIVGNTTLTQPLARMVDPGLTQGMVDWVVGHALRHTLDFDRMTHNPKRVWDDIAPPLSCSKTVGVLGLGVLGTACATALQTVGFDVAGWARRPKQVPNVACYDGQNGLADILKKSDILVLLLPDTPETENILNSDTIAMMPKGAVVLNPGRGSLIDDDALISALAKGHISGATLDVFRQEPLPKTHAFWSLPNVTVTPHIASTTRTKTASQVLVENITRGETGLPFLNLVDRSAGY